MVGIQQTRVSAGGVLGEKIGGRNRCANGDREATLKRPCWSWVDTGPWAPTGLFSARSSSLQSPTSTTKVSVLHTLDDLRESELASWMPWLSISCLEEARCLAQNSFSGLGTQHEYVGSEDVVGVSLWGGSQLHEDGWQGKTGRL